MIMNLKIKLILELINLSEEIGLSEFDLNNSKELLENKEYALAFDTIITQLYEYEIEIDMEFYDLIVKISQYMDIDEGEYSFMTELIRSENNIPVPVRERLAIILACIEANK